MHFGSDSHNIVELALGVGVPVARTAYRPEAYMVTERRESRKTRGKRRIKKPEKRVSDLYQT
jgi:hypothetical protein